MAKGHFVYLARCADGTYYCGYAVNPAGRIRTHNEGKGAKILRGKLPVRLVYVRRFAKKGAALRYELELKTLSHLEKKMLASRWRARHTVTFI